MASLLALSWGVGMAPAARPRPARAPAAVETAAAVPARTKVADSRGAVLAYGKARLHGSLAGFPLVTQIVGMAAARGGKGYWVATAGGAVYGFGSAKRHGSLAGRYIEAPIVGIAAVPQGGGYWLVGNDGVVYPFGSARSYGSLLGRTLPAPIVGIAADPNGMGYWLVARNGRVYAFGSARSYGYLIGRQASPIVGMAPTADGRGYWLATAAGGIGAFGDAANHGSMQKRHIRAKAVAVLAGPRGGYWMVTNHGGVYRFGAAPALGSTANHPPRHLVVGAAAQPGGRGYWLVEGTIPLALTGKVVVLDPGHNGRNYTDPAYINHLVWNGREWETCDTTGAETDSGYPEPLFNWNVANDVKADLEVEGATVILTRPNNAGVGPCVTVRASIGNRAHADAALSIHADGGPPSGRGYAILTPVADGPNDAVIGSSDRLGVDLRNAFGPIAHEPISNYDGVDGIQPRDDLGGINLTTVPKVFIECANMRNAADAALIVSPAWQRLAARGITAGLSEFLTGR